MPTRTCVIEFWKELERIQLRLQFVSSLRAHISQCISHETLPRICQVTDLVFLCNIWAVSMYNSIIFHCEFYDILQNCCRLSPHVSILVSGVVVQPLHKQNFHFKHRHRRNVTSHHFTSFLFTYFHFYVYSNFFGSYQLKGKYNTHTHIQQLNISLHFSSLHTLTSIIN